MCCWQESPKPIEGWRYTKEGTTIFKHRRRTRRLDLKAARRSREVRLVFTQKLTWMRKVVPETESRKVYYYMPPTPHKTALKLQKLWNEAETWSPRSCWKTLRSRASIWLKEVIRETDYEYLAQGTTLQNVSFEIQVTVKRNQTKLPKRCWETVQSLVRYYLAAESFKESHTRNWKNILTLGYSKGSICWWELQSRQLGNIQ